MGKRKLAFAFDPGGVYLAYQSFSKKCAAKTTREEIIRKSIRVFRRKGYYRTNMSDLARETGLTKGAFYHHFSNKEDVMRQSLRALSSWFEYKVFSIAYEDTLSDAEKLDAMIKMAFKAFTGEEGGCFFANTILETAHVENSFLPEISHFSHQWEKALTWIFRDRYSSSEIRDVVQQIIADIEGSIVLMQLHGDHSYLKRAMERARKQL